MPDEMVSAQIPAQRQAGVPGSGIPPGPRHLARSPRRTGLKAVAWTTAAVVTLGGLGLGFLWFKLNGNLKGVDINAALGHDRPQKADNGSLNILVLGSDSRAGTNHRYGRGVPGARSDTAMVVHIHKGRQRASVVSIPRDTIVSRPSCTRNGGGVAPAAHRVMFNEAFQTGGPACTVKTVEAMSGIRMDHYLEVDFSGFRTLIDELGGVRVSTDRPIEDRDSHLSLKPGPHTLDGEQALGLVRTRHGVGDGSDLGRIQLQQAFVKALIKQAQNVDLFGSPGKLYGLADTATQTVTTDSDLASVNDLLGLAQALKGIDARHMHMITLPVTYDPADPNRVVPMKKQDRRVWNALRHDRPIPKSATRRSAAAQVHASHVVKSA